MISFALAAALAATPVHAFRIGADWVVLDHAGKFLARHSPQAEEAILDGDISPDGGYFVFSLAAERAPGALVRWKPGAGRVEPFVEERGFYGAPRFSRNGAWLFVAHYPLNGGAPGEHAPMEYAQLYKIDVLSRQMQKLTNSNGCHMSSFSNDGREVVYGHSTCKGQKFLEKLTTSTSLASAEFQAETRLVGQGGLLDEPALSADGLTLVFTRLNGNQLELVASTPKGTRVLFAGPTQGASRPVVTRAKTVMFQHGRRVLSVALLGPAESVVLFEG